ncbi:MAG: threonine aldolase [Planctomycetota bacterium]|jgi:threonine aldolase
MRAAMAAAEVGDDVLDGDPTVRLLEERAAAFLGKERSLYVPSGTMANQIALGVWTRPGDEIIADRGAHILCYEGGALGFLHGVQSITLNSFRGRLDLDEVASAIRPDYVHCPRTALIAVEQTHMGSGGSVVPLEHLQKLKALALERGLPLHMDGARLGNAVAASGVSAADFASCADSVALCLSKGLGAPVGSIVAGDEQFIEAALRVRKRLGGWMRQAGIIAAAGLMALEEGVGRLSLDHDLAQELARRLNRFDGLSCPPDGVETNLVIVEVDRDDVDAAGLAAQLEPLGVRVMALNPTALRFVTHLDVSTADVDQLEAALSRVLGK